VGVDLIMGCQVGLKKDGEIFMIDPDIITQYNLNPK
jgi:hypothetical protein